MYEPTLGRFLSRDPKPENGIELLYPFPDMTKYGYAANNPINRTDPSGLFSQRGDRPPPRDYFECLANCIEDRSWGNVVTRVVCVGNAAANYQVGRYPRSGFGRPAGWPSSWQHRCVMGTRLSQVGKFVGRACVVYTVWEGFYDIGAEIACALICGDLYPGVDPGYRTDPPFRPSGGSPDGGYRF